MKAFAPHPNIVARPAEGTVVLVHLDTNRIFTLNRTGSRVWELIVARKDRDQIQQALHDQYDVDPAQLEAELQDLFDMLLREQLVTEDDSPHP